MKLCGIQTSRLRDRTFALQPMPGSMAQQGAGHDHWLPNARYSSLISARKEYIIIIRNLPTQCWLSSRGINFFIAMSGMNESPCEWFRTLLLKPRVCIQTTWCFAPDLDSRLQHAGCRHSLQFTQFTSNLNGPWKSLTSSSQCRVQQKIADAESKGLQVSHIIYVNTYCISCTVYQYVKHSKCSLLHILCTHTVGTCTQVEWIVPTHDRGHLQRSPLLRMF